MIPIASIIETQYPEVSGTRCISVIIPDDDAFLPLLAGLLAIPSNENNYKNDNPALAEALAQQWRNAIIQINYGACGVTRVIGEMICTPNATPDTGWLLCDGSQYARADYPTLAAMIPEGTPNIGGDATYFNVPQMGGRVPVGAGVTTQGGVNSFSMGTRGGANTVALSSSEMPNHTHSITYGGVLIDTGNAGPMQFGSGAALVAGSTPTGGAGSGSAHNNMQPYFALYYWIYAGNIGD